MTQYGLKLWSTNQYYKEEAIALHHKNIFDYIELYAVPNSQTDIKTWVDVQIPFIIHAAHSMHGFNLSLPEKYSQNVKLFEQAYQYFLSLNATNIILHPGVFGKVEETIDQLNRMLTEVGVVDRSRILIENKPHITLIDDPCVGSKPEEVTRIMDNCGVGFVLDIPHAVKYALFKKIPWESILETFMMLSPKIIHISDQFFSHPKDEHIHIGQGEFDFAKVFSFCHADYVTIETDKDSKTSLSDFVEDMKNFKAAIGADIGVSI